MEHFYAIRIKKSLRNENNYMERKKMIGVFCFSLVIKVPYDTGANQRGSRFSPSILGKYLNEQSKTIHTNQNIKHMLQDIYTIHKNDVDKNTPILLGGDHSVSIGSVFSSNDYCKQQNLTMGVLWCDAHADFNTYDSSLSKNLHGMPIAVLCGHTLPKLNIGQTQLLPSQFSYFGVRDIDKQELYRIRKHNMVIHKSVENIIQWVYNYDRIHLSFDIDCIDSNEIRSVNTPCKNGISIETLRDLFTQLKSTNKLVAIDIVEYNPKFDENGADAEKLGNILSVFKNS